ncbi:MAG TPA: FliM/FliN family flagellar motor switch protein [Hyphomonadaceae bacterium]|jgi:flagellar motor switch protein FliN/FliY|nr:FliM/FliN family flagellar motor switch protein [Hyphomonadaceae bacterium]
MSSMNGHLGGDGASQGVKLNGSHGPTQTVLDNVDVRVETFVGETKMPLARLNALKTGGIVALDAGLNELVELRVNGVTIAHGELVAVGDKFGVRIVKVAQ